MVAGRTVNDLFVEYILQLSLLAMTVERAAGELYRLMGEEVGEIEERLEEGTVGSSTMPHKVNPKYVVRILAQCAELRSFAVPALESGLSKHEGDAVANHLLSAVTDRVVPLAWRLAEGFADLLDRVSGRCLSGWRKTLP
jgi:3-carboxy-cis,cis-muconate cycloisomerase